MLRTRVIPCLLLRNRSLVKTIKFKRPSYVGEAINTVRIYNEQEVDELVFLDIMATNENRQPKFDLISEIASECFMPFAYGGGVRTLSDAEKLFNLGVEKLVINSCAHDNINFITQIASQFGSQSVIASIDAKKGLLGKYKTYSNSGKKSHKISPVEFAKKLEEYGAGEILLTSMDQDGVMQGYDLNLITSVANSVTIPVIACGGAGELGDFPRAVAAGASAVAAGSLMVYQGRNRSVLTQYPARTILEQILT